MLLAQIAALIREHDCHQICSEPGCGVHDGAVGPCDWCRRPVCLEHDGVLMNRDIDSDMMLCQTCGDRFDQDNGLVFDEEDGHPLIYGLPHSRGRRTGLLLHPHHQALTRLQVSDSPKATPGPNSI